MAFSAQGHGPGSRIIFVDRLHGPCVMLLTPKNEERQYDEWKSYRETHPDLDWDGVQAARAQEQAEIKQRREPE